ncbi:MAG TPA: DUF6368 family protein, partial [Abditibacteriaceae bacterium]
MPSASVLLRELPAEQESKDFELWIKSFSRNFRLAPQDDEEDDFELLEGEHMWKFEIQDTESLGMEFYIYEENRFHFGVNVFRNDGFVERLSSKEREYWVHHIGYIPKAFVGVYAEYRKREDNLLLGSLVAEIAERFRGIIDFEASIESRAISKKLVDTLYGSTISNQDLLKEVREF